MSPHASLAALGKGFIVFGLGLKDQEYKVLGVEFMLVNAGFNWKGV